MKPLTDPAEIRRALSVILEPGQVTEIRALNVTTPAFRRPHTVSGYFDNHDALIAAVDEIPIASGIYFIPNPINPALLARSENRARPVDKEPLTSDADILVRRWLLIDLDPVRPAGISATDEEVEKAMQRAKEIGQAMKAEGWPKPVLAASGNGAHLLYRCELPNSDEIRDAMKKCLAAMDFRFSDAEVAVDTTTFNAARIWKLYGTASRKGDDTADRPHRKAVLHYVP